MSWHLQANQYLIEGEYNLVQQVYEQLVETESEVVSHYWYLGLSYLLQQQEEDAQATWLLVLSQAEEEDIQQWTTELIEILETEAQRQQAQENYELSWLIRAHLREIEPNLINNLLNLIKLERKLNRFNISFLEEWEVINLLQQNPVNSVNNNLLIEVLAIILLFPTQETVAFAEASIIHLLDSQAFIATVMSAIVNQGYQYQQPLFTIELIKLCLQLDPNNLYLHDSLFWVYKAVENYQEALEIANKFYQSSKTLPLQLYGNYLRVNVLLHKGAWIELPPILERHQQLLSQTIEEKPKILTPFVRDSLLTVISPLPYLEDNPRKNRRFQNQISQLFQDNLEIQLPSINPITQTAKRENQPLKIGYIAHTLKRHSVGWLSRWLFRYLNKDLFHVFLYLVNQTEDDLTQNWFRPHAVATYNFTTNPQKIATQIQQDKIDILVDLDSITKNVTCQVMALKPAPIQVTWLGLDASGISTIDYFIADPYVLPENAQDYYQEKIWRLPNTYLAVDGFELGVPTRRRQQLNIPDNAIVYLSSQTGLKRHPDTIRLQMQILKQVPNSYFLIKGGDEKTIQELFIHLAEEQQLSPNRLRFLTDDPTSEIYRANLQIADVVLDTYPYNGATTTLEVLWAGIPLVTKVGQQFAARNSYTFMINAGIEEGIAWSDEEYIDWGIRLGTEEKLRQQITWKLRNSRKTAPLWNARKFTLEMEQAYQQMWARVN